MAYTTIDKPDLYFNTVTYTGDGTNGQNITGINFQPDLCWIKSRTAAQEQMWYDAVRGNDKLLRSNNTAGDATTSTTVYFNSFDSDGFTVGSETALGANGANFVGWNWLADNTSGSSNTDGSITSTVSASTTSGFSIVSYTGNGTLSTVGHGLSSSPSFYVIKDRDNGTYDWFAYHKSLGATKYLRLSGTDASTTSSTLWNDTEPTSSVFTIGGSFLGGNTNGNNYIAYCFSEVKGFSKYGSYIGNGSSDGVFCYTGFKPAMVMVKSSSVAGTSWNIWDNKRTPINSMFSVLAAESSNAEYTDSSFRSIDFTSQGFKIRVSAADLNTSSASYTYIAFAESPFTTSTGIPTTAR